MPFVDAKCTNCGAVIKVDNTKDALICQYCGSAFIVEKAINNYNVTNNINAKVVNIYGGNSADFVIRAGVLEKYNGASTEVVIPNSVIVIGVRAFEYCYGLTSVIIPEGVQEIMDSAFFGCQRLNTVTFPSSLIKINAYAFCGCPLAEITIPPLSYSYRAFDNCGLSIATVAYGTTVISDFEFSCCNNLKSINLPNSITWIGKESFQNCISLEEIVIPDSVTYIGNNAFSGCDSLRSIVLSRNLKQIEYDSFLNCRSLERIIIPEAVESIGSNAFRGCSSLKEIKVSKNGWKKFGKELKIELKELLNFKNIIKY